MSTASKKANALNTFFSTCFNQSFPQLTLEYAPDLPPQECPAEILCTEPEVFNILNTLDSMWPGWCTGKMQFSYSYSTVPGIYGSKQTESEGIARQP